MNKKWLVFIILLLLTVNLYTLYGFYRFRQQNTGVSQESVNDELYTLKLNFWANIQNSDITLDDILLKDSLSNICSINDIWKDGRKQILVCRFSESHCESCVDFSIQTIASWIPSMGKEHVLFLGSYRNNRMFNQTSPLHQVHPLNAYNIPKLNLPAEELGYPYYFVLHEDLTVSNLFIPDKAASDIAYNYLNTINKRYFVKRNRPYTPTRVQRDVGGNVF